MHKKIFLFLLLFASHLSSYADDEVLMRMYERLEMVRTQMQQLTEENQQLNNKITNLQNQQDRLYQDLILKIQELENKLEEQVNKNKKKLDKNSEKINNPNESTQNIPNPKLEDDVIAKKENVIPQDENELDLAKPYVNNDFMNNLSFYEQKTEIELYRNAFQLVKDKKYSDAEDAFNAFLYLFPESNYAANAQYWLSESIYALNDFTNAMVNFARVVEKYPNSSKVADAKLKIGYCYYSIKKWKEARFIFSSIAKDYPNTSLSQLAEKKIKSMDVEGR